MDLILYFSWIKLKSVFSPKDGTWKLIGFLALLIAFCFEGFVVAMATNEQPTNGNSFVIESIKSPLLGFIFFIPLVLAYFPNYKPLTIWFNSFQPMNSYARYATNILSDIIDKTYFCLLALLLPFLIFTNEVRLLFSIQAILVLNSAFIFRRIFQSLIEFQFEKTAKNYKILISSLVIITLISINFILNKNNSILTDIFSFLLFIYSGFLIEQKLQKSKKPQEDKMIIGIAYQWSLFFKNKNVRTPFLFALGFKMIFILLILTNSNQKLSDSEAFYNNPFIRMMMFSPMILFTYVFNNIWGYYRNYWMLINNSTTSGYEIFKNQLQLMLFPALIDMIISLGAFILIQESLTENLIAYFGSLIILSLASFFWSIRFSRYIDKPMAMRNNTNFFAGLASMLFVSGFFSLRISNWFYLIIPIYALLGIYLFLSLNSYYGRKKESIYLNLFKK
ncbi:MAG: hypothetical protein JEZ03_11365 [Bacteroidales bacterium]|nr:hypothetical protein [Bacteroidales bacterium]